METDLEFERAEKPPIHLIDSEADVIADLALRIGKSAPELSKMLLDEVDRAAIHEPSDLPPQVVRLGSLVDYVDESTGRERRIRIVLPSEADIDEGAVSILTSVGAGLIGLSAGQSISWRGRDGGDRVLHVAAVEDPPRE